MHTASNIMYGFNIVKRSTLKDKSLPQLEQLMSLPVF